MPMRAMLRRGRAELTHRLGQHRRALRRLDGSRALILMYHRVLPRALARDRAVEPGMYVTPETFRAHLRWLREDFNPVPLDALVSALEGGPPLPERAVALTFDDGWRDNWTYAQPALEAEGVPATIFLVAERVGTEGAFWPDEVARRLAGLSEAERRERVRRLGAAPGRDATDALLRHLKACGESERARALEALRKATPPDPVAERELLDWEEVERMAQGGTAFESHGASHAILTELDASRARMELERSRELLAERGHGQGRLLAYPSGAEDASIRAAARASGYRAAVTTRPGLAGLGSDPFSLPRVGVHEDISRSRAELLRRVLWHAGG